MCKHCDIVETTPRQGHENIRIVIAEELDHAQCRFELGTTDSHAVRGSSASSSNCNVIGGAGLASK